LRDPTFYGAYRRCEHLWVEPIEKAPFHLLDALGRGSNLGAACELAMAHDPSTEEKLGDWFQRWVTLGWITAVRV
jgi:hypothetical protein